MQTKTLGIGVIIIGVLILVYSGFNYITSEKVVEVGNIHIDKKTKHRVSISPIIGIVFLAGGMVLLFNKKSG